MPTPTCHSCGEALGADAHFCSNCGAKVHQGDVRYLFTPKYLLLSCGAGALLWAGLWFNQSSMLGPKPSESYTPTSSSGHAANTGQYNDPDIERLRKLTKTSPKDEQSWIDLGKLVISKVRSKTIPADQGIFEAIDALGKALELAPDNRDALLLLADLTFEQRAFSKAKEYYEQLLSSSPEDADLQARYASTLTFLGEHDQAIVTLKKLIEDHPDHFQGHAFLAIAYTQSGNKEQALEVGKRALPLAPSEEARARFQLFLDSLSATKDTLKTQGTDEEKLSSYFSTHPIIGPKVTKHALKDGIFTLFVQNFPMDQMPPQAKEKFFQSIKSYVEENTLSAIQKIRFVDAASNMDLAEVPIE